MTVHDHTAQEAKHFLSPPIRVLFVSRWLIAAGGGGVQTYIASAARALAEQPVQLDFAALMPGSLPAFAQRDSHLGDHGISKWHNARRLRSWLEKTLPDVDLVFFHGVMDWHFVVGAIQSRQMGVPYIARTAGGLLRVPFERSPIRRLESRLFLRLVVTRLLRSAACVIASTAPERDSIHAIDGRIRVRIVPVGTDVPLEPEGAALRASADTPLRLVFLGRLEPIKGIPVLLRAVQSLDRRRVPVVLAIVGKGDPTYERNLRTEIEELGIGAKVTFHGDLRGEAKRAQLTDSHVLVLPSYSENFGFVVVEAMAQGVPVVVSDGVGLAETIRRDEAGQVFPRGQAEALASALAVYRDSAILRTQGLRAHQCAQRRFSIEAMGAALSQVFRDVLTRPE